MSAYDLFPRKRLDIIWNHTRICTQNCADCCVDAVYVSGKRDHAAVLSSGLSCIDFVPIHSGETKYAAGQRQQQSTGRELSFDKKLQVLQNLEGFDVRIDLSGGDALVTPDGFPLLKACAARLGSNNVTLTVTGAGLKRSMMREVAGCIAELNFTFNAATPDDIVSRPAMYAKANLKMAMDMAELGVSVRAECPLVKGNCDPDHLTRLYMELQKAGVDTLLIMRQFAVGRGQLSPELVPTRSDYIAAIKTLQDLERRFSKPRLKIQCALRQLAYNEGLIAQQSANPCDAVRESYGLMADGTLLASPWAIGPQGQPLDPGWVIGNLADTPLWALLRKPHVQSMMYRSDENWGHCKIFAFQHSAKSNPLDRMHDLRDPLITDPNQNATSSPQKAISDSAR